jgi:enoyl-CoA hydratase
MGDNMLVRVERDGPVTTVIINRPQARNAVDRPTADALASAFLEFENDDNVRVAVLCGEGGTFCAGADLKGVAEGRGNRVTRVDPDKMDALTADGPMGPTRMRLSKPVIAAVSGYAVAGGLELALWCDLRVAEEDAVFGVFCRRWGVPLIDGGTVRLPRLIGQSRALDMILTGRGVEAAEALTMGLANRVVPKGHAKAAAQELAHQIARFPQICMTGDRSSVYEQFDLDFVHAMANEMKYGATTLKSGEAARGAARFSEGKGRGGRFDDL